MPLGWNIAVYRQETDGMRPATLEAAFGSRLAVWQTGLNGLDWLKRLAAEQLAIDLGGNGYPCRYTARARAITPLLQSDPPLANRIWIQDAGDVVLAGWPGKTIQDIAAIEACSPDEWLIIEAWDES